MKSKVHAGMAVGIWMTVFVAFAAGCNTHGKQVKAGSEPVRGDGGDYAPDQVLVKFKAQTAPEKIEKLQSQLGLETVKAHLLPNLYLMKILTDVPVNEMVEKLQRVAFVEYAEPNYRRKLY